jgi:hypothetical protein
MTRAFDEIKEDTPGQTLTIKRNHPKIRWASMREAFSPFSLAATDWSELRIEANPPRITLSSAPSAKKRAELLITDKHQIELRFGEEFGGPIQSELLVRLADAVCLSVSFRIKRLRQREGCKDLSFRCANILGLDSYQIEHDDAQHLKLCLSRRKETEQLAYREESRVSLQVPIIRGRANYQRASVAHDGTPRRAHDDSYFVFSWDQKQLLHFVSSTKIDWDTPRSEWKKSALREVIINFPDRSLSYQHDSNKQEIPLHLLSHVYLSRAVIESSCQVSLYAFYRGINAFQSGSLLLAESSLCESHDEAFESVSLLASALTKEIKIPCFMDLIPSGQDASLSCVSASPNGLIFAGGNNRSAIAYVQSAPDRFSTHTAKSGAFADVSRGNAILLACSTGDIHELPLNSTTNQIADNQWIEHRPLGRAHLRAIAQNKTGEALAVGENGRVFLKQPTNTWEGIPKEHLPLLLQNKALIGVVFYEGSSSVGPGFLVASRSGVLSLCSIKPSGISWSKLFSLDGELARLLTNGGRYWAVMETGKLMEITVSERGIASEAMFFPTSGKIIAAFPGIGRALLAVGDDGSLSEVTYTDVKSIQPRKIEVAHAILDLSLGDMSKLGLWSSVAIGWAPRNTMPSLTWSAAAHQNGYFYLVGGDCLLRLSGRL